MVIQKDKEQNDKKTKIVVDEIYKIEKRFLLTDVSHHTVR